MYKFFAAVALILSIVPIHGAPEICYYCRTPLEGTVCNDPVNTTAIYKQQCSDFTLVQSFLSASGRAKAEQYNSARADDDAVVCTTLSYVDGGTLATLRNCDFAVYEEKDVCSFFRDDMENNPVLNYQNFSCKSCDTDLCNTSSSTRIYASVTIMILGILIKLMY